MKRLIVKLDPVAPYQLLAIADNAGVIQYHNVNLAELVDSMHNLIQEFKINEINIFGNKAFTQRYGQLYLNKFNATNIALIKYID